MMYDRKIPASTVIDFTDRRCAAAESTLYSEHATEDDVCSACEYLIRHGNASQKSFATFVAREVLRNHKRDAEIETVQSRLPHHEDEDRLPAIVAIIGSALGSLIIAGVMLFSLVAFG